MAGHSTVTAGLTTLKHLFAGSRFVVPITLESEDTSYQTTVRIQTCV
jgi:hypothetical protein